MRILAVIRQVLDAESTVRVTAGAVDLSSSRLVTDTMDEYGIEQALRMREAGAAADGEAPIEVIAVAVGPARTEEALRHALAMGADRAILVECDQPLDVMATSAVVAAVARAEAVELIFTGGQQADWDSHGLGPAIAERLDWPQATWTNAFTLGGNGDTKTIEGRHDTDAGSESFRLTLPAVITTQQGLNEPRYATLPNIMKARKKELRRDAIAQYGAAPRLKVLSAALVSSARQRQIFDGKDPAAAAQNLVVKLRDEAKVIA